MPWSQTRIAISTAILIPDNVHTVDSFVAGKLVRDADVHMDYKEYLMLDAMKNEIKEGDYVAYIVSSSSPYMKLACVLKAEEERICVAPRGLDSVWLRSSSRVVLYRDPIEHPID